MPRPTAPTLALIAGCVLMLAGCGEKQQVFKDPNELPPISADAAAALRDQDAAIADAERAESARIAKPRLAR